MPCEIRLTGFNYDKNRINIKSQNSADYRVLTFLVLRTTMVLAG